jgi:hypothetical protein
METSRKLIVIMILAAVVAFSRLANAFAAADPATKSEVRNGALQASAQPSDGSYRVSGRAGEGQLWARVAAQVDHHWLRSSDYPRHVITPSSFTDGSTQGQQLSIRNTGLGGQPDLVCTLRLHSQPDYLEVVVRVDNTFGKATTVQTIRPVEAVGKFFDLGGPDASDRVLSDSYSEDRPSLVIRDLASSEGGIHRGVGSQLIYNRESKHSLFLAALTSEKLLTVLRLHVSGPRITAYEVDSTGTTELAKENSLESAPSEDQIELSVPVARGEGLDSERLLISIGSDYHKQLETYGTLVRELHHARVSAPSAMGWWSWTAYYFALNQGTALTNAQFLAEHLKHLGYNFFHIDEGYGYARGEYITPDAALFPDGMRSLEGKIRALGLTPGVWTSPFQISERSWVFQNHQDWLVANAAGKPIHAGSVTHKQDQLYVLDVTNPDAQDYLRRTYTTLTKEWGIRYIKLDFMEDAAIEGYYHVPHTTALEAQRIGLKIIRDTVGEGVLLDKDGSPMLNPVGLVDTGRISVDTGHTFEAYREAAPAIAARYYMNRNFYINDPDAFSVSRQTVVEQEWHGGKRPLTLDEAKVAISLAAVAGGMFEIGDDLPTLYQDPGRVALVENQDLINMARLGRASVPLDLMTYRTEDEMPSVFLLQESRRQAILAVFNWTEKEIKHDLALADLPLPVHGTNQVFDVFAASQAPGTNLDVIPLPLAPRSVRVFKIVQTSLPPAAPTVQLHAPKNAELGQAVTFSAEADARGAPALAYHWDFGDGTTSDGAEVNHTFTRAGQFQVHLTVDGIEELPFENTFSLTVSGEIDTRFTPSRNRRYQEH